MIFKGDSRQRESFRFYGWKLEDEVAEWLRRWTANPMCYARVGSNPILVATFWLFRHFSSF